jgi:lysozyme family protein
VLKAPCFFAQCTHSRTFTLSLGTSKHNGKSLTNITRSRHHTNRRRGDRPEQAHQ